MQDGRRKPNSASIDLRAKSPRIHAADLRHGDVALVDDQQRVVGQVLEQRRRRLARLAAGEVARIVLDAGAASRSPPSSPCRRCVRCSSRCASSSLPLGVELGQPQLQVVLDLLDRLLQRRLRRHVVAVGVDLDLARASPSSRRSAGRTRGSPRSRRRTARCARRGPPDGPGTDLDRVAAHAEGAALEVRRRCGCTAARRGARSRLAAVERLARASG